MSLRNEEATAIAGGQGRSVVEQRARVEDFEHLGVRMADAVSTGVAELGQDLGELAAAWGVNSLQQAPVAAGRKGEIVVIGQAVGPPASRDAHGQVLVDDNHAQPPVRCSVVVLAPAEHRVYDRVGVESGLERRRQIAAGDSAQYLPVGVTETRIAGSAPPAALVEKLLTDGHGLHSAPRPCGRSDESAKRLNWTQRRSCRPHEAGEKLGGGAIRWDATEEVAVDRQGGLPPLRWPTRPATVARSVPEASNAVATKWRRSCRRTMFRPTSARSRVKRRVQVSGRMGREPSSSAANTNCR